MNNDFIKAPLGGSLALQHSDIPEMLGFPPEVCLATLPSDTCAFHVPVHPPPSPPSKCAWNCTSANG